VCLERVRIPSVLETNQATHPTGVHCVLDCVRIRQRRRKRLLDEQVFARRGGSDSRLAVSEVGGGDDDRVRIEESRSSL
jgi:hypothetical protein